MLGAQEARIVAERRPGDSPCLGEFTLVATKAGKAQVGCPRLAKAQNGPLAADLKIKF